MDRQESSPNQSSSLHHRVQIQLGARSYAIDIGPGLIANPSTWQVLPKANMALIVSNTTVAPIYGETLRNALQSRFRRVEQLVLPDGEAHKAWETLQLIFDALLRIGADRKSVLFALGGGVVGDMTGFAAASYMRGIPYVQVPTTLLAQVDSSVGGKTAINHPMGKNMIGAFYQPIQVVCDLETLESLPPREFAAGLAEVIKYGPIADMAFFDWLEKNINGLVARNQDDLAYAVKRSCEIKADVVGKDERESDLRAILNFGHTFGHAIETAMGYGTFLHGEAVAIGMNLASNLSRELNLIDDELVCRLQQLLTAAGLPTKAPGFSLDRWMELMRIDKKAEAGEIRFVVLESPGQARVQPVPDDIVRRVILQHSERIK